MRGAVTSDRDEFAAYVSGYAASLCNIVRQEHGPDAAPLLADVIRQCVLVGLKGMRFKDGHSLQDLAERSVRFAQDNLGGKPLWPVNVTERVETAFREGMDEGGTALQVTGPFNRTLADLASEDIGT